MNENFSRALAWVLEEEGGWAHNAHDPGGDTMKGVTQVVYAAYRRNHGLFIQSVARITQPELEDIYRTQYWNPIGGPWLPSGVDYCSFDLAVNSGPDRAVKFLQRACGAKPVDGHAGILTRDAIAKASSTVTITLDCMARLSFLHALFNWKFFGNGWKARVGRVEMRALALARGEKFP